MPDKDLSMCNLTQKQAIVCGSMLQRMRLFPVSKDNFKLRKTSKETKSLLLERKVYKANLEVEHFEGLVMPLLNYRRKGKQRVISSTRLYIFSKNKAGKITKRDLAKNITSRCP